jgi:hypothetical protein
MNLKNALVVLLLILISAGTSHAAIEDVCGNLKSLKGIKYKAIPSDHITTGPRVGGISLIYKKGVSLPSQNCLIIYDSNGNLLGKLGKYSPNGNIFGARYYSGTGCAGRTNRNKISKKAFDATGNRQGYISYGGNSCLVIENLVKDEGSVR